MEKLETKVASEVDIVDPSTPLVAVASVTEGTTSSTALDDEDIHRKGEREAPVQYRLYKRRWWGIVALVRAPLRYVRHRLNPWIGTPEYH